MGATVTDQFRKKVNARFLVLPAVSRRKGDALEETSFSMADMYKCCGRTLYMYLIVVHYKNNITPNRVSIIILYNRINNNNNKDCIKTSKIHYRVIHNRNPLTASM
jgi:hypothetical protein